MQWPGHEHFGGAPVVLFDGKNQDDILAALGLEIGDGVVILPDGRPVILWASALAEIWAEAPPAEGGRDRLFRTRDIPGVEGGT